MPGFDHRGPFGQGPMTGGGFGYCGNSSRAGYGIGGRGASGGVGGRGAGRGRGRGVCRRDAWNFEFAGPQRFYGQSIRSDPEGELAGLRQEAEEVRGYLKDMETRIAALEKTSE